MNEIIYRPAQKSEASDIARYMTMASGGIYEFLLHDLLPGITPVQMLAREIEDEKAVHSYRYTHVAISDGNIVGISQSYPTPQNHIPEELEKEIPKERLEVLREVFNLRVEDSLYLNVLGVAANCRGQGIGKQLISIEKQKAKQLGFPNLSLFVVADNNGAIRLYEKQNFQEVKRVNIAPQPLFPHDSVILMNCQLD